MGTFSVEKGNVFSPELAGNLRQWDGEVRRSISHLMEPLIVHNILYFSPSWDD